MKKLVLVAVFLLGFSVMAMAQDLPKFEIFGGYSLVLVDTTTALRSSGWEGMDLNLNGWDSSITFNANKYLGFVAEFGGYYGTVGYEERNSPPYSWADISIHSIMVGPKFTLHRGKASPFVQGLLGYARVKATELGESYTEDDMAMALGGGIDVSLNERISLRPVQLDYFATRGDFTGDFADHLRFSTGFIIKLGKR
jgi:opacity protein-like surface antigen